MTREPRIDDVFDIEQEEWLDTQCHDTDISRRTFLKVLGAGLLITVTQDGAQAQRRSRNSQSMPVLARLHLNQDGLITVLTESYRRTFCTSLTYPPR